MNSRTGMPDAPWITLGDLVRTRAAQTPDDDAVAFDDAPALTCAELDQRSDVLAAWFAHRGVAKGDRIASMLRNSPEQLLCWLAAAKLGAIAVPINVSLRESDLEHVLRTTQPSCMLIEPEFVAVYEAARPASSAPIHTEILTGGGAAGTYIQFADAMAHTDPAPRVEVSPADPAAVIFTGGTTGLPKAVLRPHYSYMCSAARYAEIFAPVAGDRHYSVGQLFHIGGQEAGFVGPFMNRVPTRIRSWFSASSFWSDVRSHRATIIEAVGPRITLLLRQPATPLDIEHHVRAALAGTRGLPPEARSEFATRFGIDKLVEIYAMTETGALLFRSSDTGDHPSRVYPHGWCEAIAADERGFKLPSGEEGELLLRSTVPYSFGIGYLGDDAATVAHWRNLWVHTGDVGRVYDDGSLEFVGRQAHWLRRRGENVSALEVEQVLDSHPDVIESAVVGIPSELGEDDIRAIVVTDRAIDDRLADEVFDWCESHLAYFKVPRFVEFRDERLPRTSTKRDIERHVLREEKPARSWERPPGRGRRSAAKDESVRTP